MHKHLHNIHAMQYRYTNINIIDNRIPVLITFLCIYLCIEHLIFYKFRSISFCTLEFIILPSFNKFL